MPGPAIVVIGLAVAGYTIYRGVAHGEWPEVNIGPKEKGYMWEDSVGDSGIETGSPPPSGAHPRKPGTWNPVD